MTEESEELGMSQDNWLYIWVTLRSDRRASYRVRGMGENYKLLGEYLSMVACTDEWNDFPWYGWKFADPEAEKRFREIYGPLISFDKPPYAGFTSFEDMDNPAIAPAERAHC